MSVQTETIILHTLHYTEGEGVSALLSGTELAVSESVEQLTAALHQNFQLKSNRSYAHFSDEPDQSVESGSEAFVSLLESALLQKLPYLDFSNKATQLLVEQVNKYSLVCQGYLYFIKYKYVGVDYLLVGLLEPQESVSFTDGLDIQRVSYIDLEKMSLVARVDITDYQKSPELQRYLSFLKGRAGRKVADFFLDFLSAKEGVSQKVQNEALVQAVCTYAQAHELPAEQLQGAKKEILGYCKEQIKSGEELDTKALASFMPDADGMDFYSFLTTDVGLPESFPPSQTALRALTKYVGSGGGLTLSFDEKLLGERIHFDAAADTLTVVGLPPNLRDQLLRNNR